MELSYKSEGLSWELTRGGLVTTSVTFITSHILRVDCRIVLCGRPCYILRISTAFKVRVLRPNVQENVLKFLKNKTEDCPERYSAFPAVKRVGHKPPLRI